MKQEAQYDWLKDEVHCLYERNSELKQRIDKAIEYIEENVAVYGFNNKDLPHWEFNDDNVMELLKILKGE